MNELYKEIRYKKNSPYETIRNIRDILHKQGMIFIEEGWNRNCHDLWSVHLKHPILPIGVNGKGRTAEYSLASAYGELMERIQNLTFPAISQKYSDEVELSYEEIINGAPFLADNLLDGFDHYLRSEKGAISCIPFYNQTLGKVDYIPKDIFAFVNGSNGMCAGNSLEEAIIQGTCEFFERFILHKIYKEDLLYPTIPNEDVKEYSFYRNILLLQEQGYEVYLKDFSLGGRLPVYGIILRKGNRARLSLGGAPNTEIALERCITEIFQGISPDYFDNLLQPITPHIKSEEMVQEFYRQLKTSTGKIPEHIFIDGSSKVKKHLFTNRDFTGSQTVRELVDIVHKEGYHFLYRDVSFLGFPAFQIFIPEMCCQRGIINEKSQELVDRLRDRKSANSSIFNIEGATAEELDILTAYLNNLINDKGMQIRHKQKALYNIPVNYELLFGDYDLEQLLTMLQFYKGDYKAAYSSYKQYMVSGGIEEPSHKCLLHFLQLLSEGKKLDEISESLKSEHPSEAIEENYNVLKSAMKEISSLFNLKKCDKNCSQCSYEVHCYNDELEIVKINLKRAIEKYDFSQHDRISG